MLSQTSKYALNALVELAKQPDGSSLTGSRLSELANVPANYLAKIMHLLNRAGIVSGTRGPKGGYRLRRPPSQITLSEIVHCIDGQNATPSCLMWKFKPCSENSPCNAHHKWAPVKTALESFLADTTIEELSN